MRNVQVNCYVCGGPLYSRLDTGAGEEDHYAHERPDQCIEQLRKRFEALEAALSLTVHYVVEKG